MSLRRYAQSLRTLRVGSLVVTLALPCMVSAKPVSHDSGQLIIDNFVNAPAPLSPEPRLDTRPLARDIALGSPPIAAAEAASPIAAMMAAQFNAAKRSRAAGTGAGSASAGMRIASPPTVVRRPLLAQSAGYQPKSGPCPSYPYRNSSILKPESETQRQMLLPYVVHEACAAGIPAGLLDALIIQESRYNALAISTKGAIGLTQLMPNTAANIGANAYSVEDNIRGGAAYLRSLMDTFGGQAHLALAAYNAGPGAVIRYGGVPSFRETQGYVASILSLWGYLSQ